MRRITTTPSWQVASNLSVVAFQVTGAIPVEVSVAVSNPQYGFTYAPGYGDRGAIADLFPGSNGAVWVRSAGPSEIVVS